MSTYLIKTLILLLLCVNLMHAQNKPVQVTLLKKTTKSWNNTLLPAYPKGQPEVSILKVVVPPGSAFPMHKHPNINGGVLIKEQITVYTKGKNTLHVKAGDAVVELVEEWHYGKNEGKVDAEIIIFYAGVEGEPLSIKH